jgi:hypothetical protein
MLTTVLRLTTALLLLGHAWVCWNGDMPLRALLWDEGLVKGTVKGLTGMEWGEWVGSLEVDAKISAAVKVQAGIFLLLAIAALLPIKGRALIAVGAFATLNLTFLAWLKYHDSADGIGQFVEHLGQILTPLVLLFWVRGLRRVAWWTAAFGIACTFIGHGLFALDIESQTPWANHPRPGQFTEMTMLCLGLETEESANRILVVAGVLDLVVAALIFTAAWPRVIALWWMAAWGLATALARPWAYYEPTSAAESLDRWIPEALYRAPHFAIPVFLLLALRARRAEITGSPS